MALAVAEWEHGMSGARVAQGKGSAMNTSRARILVAAAVLTAMGFAVAWIPPARAAIEAALSCAKPSPCFEWDNTLNGAAIKGVSISGNALYGQTQFNSAGKTAGKAGVFGQDLSTTGNLDAGVNGVSTNGAGVVGTSTNWNGVEGMTAGAGTSGVYGQNSDAGGFGVAGRNVTPINDPRGAGVLADGGPNNDGLRAVSTSNIAGLFTDNPGDFSYTLKVLGGTTNTGQIELEILSSDSNEVMGVSDAGNLFIRGQIFTVGSCQHGCVAGTRQTRSVTEYTPTESEPTIEDFGSGMLASGRADIALDPKFANVIDPNVKYFVWMTPEGDCRGLYIASQTARSFTVRELQGGHSSVPFEYRVVAKRYGVNSPRLPMAAIRRGVGSSTRQYDRP